MGGLIELYGHEIVRRAHHEFTTIAAPRTKNPGNLISEVLGIEDPDRTVVGESLYLSGSPPTPQQLGGLSKALDDYARVIHIRIEFLLLLEQGEKRHVARGFLAKRFDLSKDRIRKLTHVRK